MNLLNTLAGIHHQAKLVENVARNFRVAIEELIIRQLPETKHEGTVRVTEGGFKTEATFKLKREIDEARRDALKGRIPAPLYDAIFPEKNARGFDLKLYRSLESTNPQAFALISSAIIEKPEKTAIKVEPVQ